MVKINLEGSQVLLEHGQDIIVCAQNVLKNVVADLVLANSPGVKLKLPEKIENDDYK